MMGILHCKKTMRLLCFPLLFLLQSAVVAYCYQRQPSDEGGSVALSAWQLFHSLFHASESMSGVGTAKTNGVPPVMLSAIAQVMADYLPPSRAHRTGCVVAANAISGPAARGTYDLLLAPTKAHNEWCVAPNIASLRNRTALEDDVFLKMKWMGKVEFSTTTTELPPVEEVFNKVFLRQGPARLPSAGSVSLNFWFISFVNWFHDDNFRTAPHTDGGFTWSDAGGGLHMAHVYGHTEYRQRALRTFQDGKMKTSQGLGWDSLPPRLVDVQVDFPDFDMWTPGSGPTFNSSNAGKTARNVDVSTYFAIGDPRFNMHPGHIVWASLALNIHNMACDIVKAANPLFQDEDLFQRARVITFHIVQKIRLQDFVSDSVSHSRDFVRVVYDPPTLREHLTPYLRFAGARPNFLEFNHVYQAWHSLIPDTLLLNEQDRPIRELMWSPKLFSETSFQDIARAFSNTPISKYGPHSFPSFLSGVTTDALRNARSQHMQGYNAYRELLGMEPLHSFEQFSVDDPNEMRDLYNGQINNVEFLTGVLADADARLPGNLLGDVQLIVVALLALQDAASNDVVLNPILWSPDYLTEEGLDFVKTFEIRDVIQQLTGNDDAFCPFQTDACRFSSYKEPDQVEVQFMKSICSFVNVDVALVDWFWIDNGYSRLFMLYLTVSTQVV